MKNIENKIFKKLNIFDSLNLKKEIVILNRR
jgi:hypothetical protein